MKMNIFLGYYIYELHTNDIDDHSVGVTLKLNYHWYWTRRDRLECVFLLYGKRQRLRKSFDRHRRKLSRRGSHLFFSQTIILFKVRSVSSDCVRLELCTKENCNESWLSVVLSCVIAVTDITFQLGSSKQVFLSVQRLRVFLTSIYDNSFPPRSV